MQGQADERLGKEGWRLFVGGLPKPLDQHSSDLEIRELFNGFAVEAVSEAKSLRKLRGWNKNAWFVFVDLCSPEEAQRAQMKLNGINRWGGRLKVNLATNRAPKPSEEW